MSRRMQAAILHAPNQPLVIEEVTIGPPQVGEVLIHVVASGICHSDVNVVTGDEKQSLPVILGHEVAGYVAEVGAGVTHVTPGDRVAAGLWRSCGRCYYCGSGLPSLCVTAHILDTEARIHDRNGHPIRRGMRVAGWAEYALVDQSQVVPVPEAMPLEAAALVGCGVITGVGAVIHTAQVEVGSSVVVIGLGGVGINVVQAARIAGARHIVAIDLLDDKLATARAFGATHTVNPRQDDAVRFVKELTDGRGAEYVFLTVGNVHAITQGFDMIRKRGTTVLIGLVPDGAVVPIPANRIARTEGRIIGSFLGSTRLHVAFPQLADLYAQGRLKLDELISGTFPLDQINEAIAIVRRGEAIRNVIVMAT
ncbi:MAG TPA: Zn-dependent alcohol dehydrogenase [Roseiflexaceae bacterium]|nr:Zn-dependent alcohol dehydrogenase [Roseiflexaceae bacterium]HMP38989.1 Zn-dependent alcohol dehydrogenase [Roseiflexaceae bacterium]